MVTNKINIDNIKSVTKNFAFTMTNFHKKHNKINFITGMDGLSECVAYGLYVLFNSTIYDSYYRILNGSTQVNSTEVNTMPVPSLKTIENMGKELMAVKDMSVTACDQILGSYV